jgi:hypothetical protein
MVYVPTIGSACEVLSVKSLEIADTASVKGSARLRAMMLTPVSLVVPSGA